ncbi:MAG: YkvA family protein [Anaerolineae bacterium]
MSHWLGGWKRRVRQLKTETYAIYLASRDPRVPWYAKGLIAVVVAHTFSPIDLIPDFIPILGYLDDLVIALLGIALALRLIPEDVLVESREKAQAIVGSDKPTSWAAAAVIVAIWILVAALAIAIVLGVIRE